MPILERQHPVQPLGLRSPVVALADSAQVIPWQCGTGLDERWTQISSGSYTEFKVLHSGLCLAESTSPANGSPVVQVRSPLAVTALLDTLPTIPQ